jgi:exopolysaccharide production protein ExoQ
MFNQQSDWVLADRLQGQGSIVTPGSAYHCRSAQTAADVADNRKIGWFETIFAYFGLIVYCDAIDMPFRILRGAGQPTVGESDPIVATCQTLVLCILAYIFISHWRRLLPLLRFIKPFLLIIVLCLVSALWSDFPFPTVRRTATLSISVMFGVFLYQTFGLAKICRMFESLAIILSLLSVIIYYVMPSIGKESSIDDYDAVRGVFATKNMLGECCLFGFCCCAYRFTETQKVTRFFLSTILLLGCIKLSHSASALLIALLVLAFALTFALRGWPLIRMIYMYVFVSALVVVIAVMIFNPDAIFDMMGRDASLTGRVPLWQAVVEIIAAKPILGHGYGGFYNANSVDLRYLWLQFPWQPPHSHSGYLDMMVDLGVVGLLMYLWLFLFTFILALKANVSGKAPLARWVLFFLLIIVLMNLDEDTSMPASLCTTLMPLAMIEVGMWNALRKNGKVRWAAREAELKSDQRSSVSDPFSFEP